ncbi:hypothetical protein pb186bvf_008719 [Paramecium bursaria]
MDTIHQELKRYQQEIADLNQKKDDIKKNLAKIKNENTYREEKLQWLEEKIQKIEREDDQLHMKHKTPHKKKKPKQENENKEPKVQKKAEITDMQMLGFLQKFLENQNKLIESNQPKKSNQPAFINPFPVINLKHTFQNIVPRIICFRLDISTQFFTIKFTAYKYWSLNQFLDQELNEDEQLESLQLMDESGSCLDMKEQVIEFYKNKGLPTTNQVTLVLSLKQINKTSINNLQLDVIKIYGNQKSQVYKFQSIKVNKGRIKKVDSYKRFFEKFPALVYYISELQIQKEEQLRTQKALEMSKKQPEAQEASEQAYQIDDNNCLLYTLLVILLTLALLTYTSYLDPRVVSFNISSLQNMIRIIPGQDYYQIYTQKQLYDYVNQYIGETFFNSEDEPSVFRQVNELIGGVQIRQFRTNIVDCQSVVHDFQNNSCFPPFYISGSGNYDNYSDYYYESASQLGAQFQNEGNFSIYSDGGFVFNFSRDISFQQFRRKINLLKENYYIDEKTQAVIISFASIQSDLNIWMIGNFLFERNPHGQFIPYFPLIQAFIPNMYYGGINNSYMQIDITRIFFVTILLIYIIYRSIILYNTTLERQKIKRILQYIFLEAGIFNVGVIISSYLHIASAFDQFSLGLDPQELVDSQYFTNLQQSADLYEKSKNFLAISLLFILLRLSYVLRINQRITILFLTFRKGFKELYAFLTIQFPLFLGICFMFQITYGDYMHQYTTIVYSIISQFSMIQGHFDIILFSKVQPVISVIYITFYYLFMVFFMLAVYQSILIECFRQVIMKCGYPQGQEAAWTLRDVFSWVFSWKVLFEKKVEDTYQPLMPESA